MNAHDHLSGLEPLLADSAWLRRLSRGLTQHDSDGDDLAQDTWLAALGGRESVSAPRAWIGTIARRMASRQRRSARRRGDHEALAEPAVGDPRSPEETAERLELAEILAETLRGLPEPYRGTLYAHYFDGEPAAVIAERDGVAGATVRWRLSHGRSLLRERLRARDGRTWNDWAIALGPLTGAGSGSSPGAATLSSLGTIMTIKTTIMGLCAGALTAGGAWLVEAPRVGPGMGGAARSPNHRQAPPQSTAPKDLSIPAGVNPTVARTAGSAPTADGLFGVVAFGEVVDPAGKPLSSALVELASSSRPRHRARTGNRGGWSLVGVEPGEYEVTLSRPGSITARESVTIPDGPSWRYDVSLRAAMSIPVRFEKVSGEAHKVTRFGSGASILGVAATLDAPPTRLRVPGRVLSRSENGNFLSRAEDSTPPDLDARYQGLLQLNSEPPLWVSAVYRGVVLESRLLVGSEEELVFTIHDLGASNGSVRVRVVDRETGAPLTEGITLQHPSGGIPVSPRVEEGALVFSDVPPGTMDLMGGLGNYERLEREVSVDPGAELNLGTIAIGHAVPFEVRTVDVSGDPIQVQVLAVRPEVVAGPLDLGLRIRSRPDQDGVTQITWLAPGRTLLRAGGRDGLSIVAVEVDTREIQSVELSVPEGIDVAFKGLTTEGDEFCVLENSEGALLRCTESLPKGLCLAPGAYVLRVLEGGVERSLHRFVVDATSKTIDLGGR